MVRFRILINDARTPKYRISIAIEKIYTPIIKLFKNIPSPKDRMEIKSE